MRGVPLFLGMGVARDREEKTANIDQEDQTKSLLDGELQSGVHSWAGAGNFTRSAAGEDTFQRRTSKTSWASRAAFCTLDG